MKKILILTISLLILFNLTGCTAKGKIREDVSCKDIIVNVSEYGFIETNDKDDSYITVKFTITNNSKNNYYFEQHNSYILYGDGYKYEYNIGHSPEEIEPLSSQDFKCTYDIAESAANDNEPIKLVIETPEHYGDESVKFEITLR